MKRTTSDENSVVEMDGAALALEPMSIPNGSGGTETITPKFSLVDTKSFIPPSSVHMFCANENSRYRKKIIDAMTGDSPALAATAFSLLIRSWCSGKCAKCNGDNRLVLNRIAEDVFQYWNKSCDSPAKESCRGTGEQCGGHFMDPIISVRDSNGLHVVTSPPSFNLGGVLKKLEGGDEEFSLSRSEIDCSRHSVILIRGKNETLEIFQDIVRDAAKCGEPAPEVHFFA
jgi:hypothetical protein